MLQHIKNHLWREVWPAMPQGVEARQYWHVVTKQTTAMFDGGGGGMLAAAIQCESCCRALYSTWFVVATRAG